MDGSIHAAEVKVRGGSVTVNNARFRIQPVLGDGDCLFHCFDIADGLRNGPGFYRKMTNTPREWGDSRSIRIYAEITNRSVFVVIPGKIQAFVEFFKPSPNPVSEVFFLFRDSHFDYLHRIE